MSQKTKTETTKTLKLPLPSLTARERSPLTSNWAMLDTVPYLLLAVQVKHPESSENTSAMTKVQISSVCQQDRKVNDLIAETEL